MTRVQKSIALAIVATFLGCGVNTAPSTPPASLPTPATNVGGSANSPVVPHTASPPEVRTKVNEPSSPDTPYVIMIPRKRTFANGQVVEDTAGVQANMKQGVTLVDGIAAIDKLDWNDANERSTVSFGKGVDALVISRPEMGNGSKGIQVTWRSVLGIRQSPVFETTETPKRLLELFFAESLELDDATEWASIQ